MLEVQSWDMLHSKTPWPFLTAFTAYEVWWQRENALLLRTSSYFLSCKRCSENKTGGEQGFVSSFCWKLSLLSSQQLLLEYIELHQILRFRKAGATQLQPSPGREYQPTTFILTSITSSKPTARELAPSLQEAWPEPRLYFGTEEWDRFTMSTSRRLACMKLGWQVTEGSSVLTVALAVPVSLTWESNTSTVGVNTKP